jgi:streptomycin 6-kinase
LQQEITALEALKGHGCVQLLAYDLNIGAMILEQAVPGKPLTALFPHDDAKATRIAANCVRLLHQAPLPKSSLFQTLEHTLPHFKKTGTALDPFIIRAQELKQQLLATPQGNVLLHGDFHGGNILSSAHHQWVVIDPEGIIGDPVYDLTVYIRNPLTELVTCPDSLTIISNRIRDFATILGYTPQHMYDWTYLQAVISAYWSIEDKLDITRHIAFLTLLDSVENILSQ